MPDWEINIEETKGIPDRIRGMKVGDDLSNPGEYINYKLEDQIVNIPKSAHDAWAEALDKDNNHLWTRFKQFLRGETLAGRISKVLKDFALMFAPKWVSFGVNSVDQFVISAIIKRKTMSTNKDKKTLFSRQILIFGAIFIVALLQQLGLDLGLALSPEANWVGLGAGVLGIILRLVTGRPVKLGRSLGIADTGEE